mmetsp:Transcript_28674/g.65602  ORF Transcript_28674/g.65602 Transcript_28674/m.65602 type:complete len:201 (-) Transcript_28674:95-697(-)
MNVQSFEKTECIGLRRSCSTRSNAGGGTTCPRSFIGTGGPPCWRYAATSIRYASRASLIRCSCSVGEGSILAEAERAAPLPRIAGPLKIGPLRTAGPLSISRPLETAGPLPRTPSGSPPRMPLPSGSVPGRLRSVNPICGALLVMPWAPFAPCFSTFACGRELPPRSARVVCGLFVVDACGPRTLSPDGLAMPAGRAPNS